MYHFVCSSLSRAQPMRETGGMSVPPRTSGLGACSADWGASLTAAFPSFSSLHSFSFLTSLAPAFSLLLDCTTPLSLFARLQTRSSAMVLSPFRPSAMLSPLFMLLLWTGIASAKTRKFTIVNTCTFTIWVRRLSLPPNPPFAPDPNLPLSRCYALSWLLVCG